MRTGLEAAWRSLGTWLDGPASLIGEWRKSSRKGASVKARISEDSQTMLLRPAGRASGGEIAVPLGSGAEASHASGVLSGIVKGRAVEIAAPRAWVIERRIELPLEAGDHLDGIVSSRIGTLSPLPAADMLHGHKITQSDRMSKRMGVAIALLPRARATPLLDLVEQAGARRAEIVAQLAQGGSVRLHPRRAGGVSGEGFIKAVLATLLLACVLAAAGGATARIVYGTIEATERAALETRAAAARERINAFLAPETAGTLPEQRALEIKNDAISPLGALDDLAAALPSHSFASEVSLRDGRLRVAGQTRDLPDVLTALESSGRFVESSLVGPATRSEDGLSSLFMLETRPLIRTGGALR